MIPTLSSLVVALQVVVMTTCGATSDSWQSWHHDKSEFHYKGIKNGCPCIVEIRGTQGCALVGDPARAAGECRDVAKAQP